MSPAARFEGGTLGTLFLKCHAYVVVHTISEHIGVTDRLYCNKWCVACIKQQQAPNW